MKKIYTLVLAQIFAFAALFGQTNETTLYKAMQDEMERSRKELILPNSPAPFYIATTVAETRYISVNSSLGAVLSTKESPTERMHSITMFVGDSKFSSDYAYSGKGITSAYYTTIDDNYDQLRRNFWQTSDIAYKFAVEVYNSKKNNLKTANIPEEEKTFADMLPLGKVQNSVAPVAPFNFDKKAYEELAKKVSAVFSKYPQIYGSRVEIDGIQSIYYMTSTEGTKIKEPVSYSSVTLRAKVRNKKGQPMEESETIIASSLEKLPNADSLAACAVRFAEHMIAMRDASSMDEYYLGPVLFTEAATADIFASNLVSPSGIFAYRKPVQVMATVYRAENISARREIKPLEERFGKKVIDSRISVENRTDLADFNGKSLVGTYSVDAQGVVPVKSQSLIENGILKGVLSTRVETKRTKESTGAVRFGVRPRSVSMEVAPGTLLISAPGGASYDDLKKSLIASAVEEGLDYAYIVKKLTSENTQIIYKVSVKDGSETLVAGAEITPVPLSKLKRVLGVSKEQYVSNYLYSGEVPVSVISPKAILIEDVEINRKPLQTQKESPLIK